MNWLLIIGLVILGILIGLGAMYLFVVWLFMGVMK